VTSLFEIDGENLDPGYGNLREGMFAAEAIAPDRGNAGPDQVRGPQSGKHVADVMLSSA
jgi:hypothetical protein